MKAFIRFAANIVANIFVLALCPFLILAWIVRVRLLEGASRHARARRTATQQSLKPAAGAKPVWPIMGGSAR